MKKIFLYLFILGSFSAFAQIKHCGELASLTSKGITPSTLRVVMLDAQGYPATLTIKSKSIANFIIDTISPYNVSVNRGIYSWDHNDHINQYSLCIFGPELREHNNFFFKKFLYMDEASSAKIWKNGKIYATFEAP